MSAGGDILVCELEDLCVWVCMCVRARVRV